MGSATYPCVATMLTVMTVNNEFFREAFSLKRFISHSVDAWIKSPEKKHFRIHYDLIISLLNAARIINSTAICELRSLVFNKAVPEASQNVKFGPYCPKSYQDVSFENGMVSIGQQKGEIYHC